MGSPEATAQIEIEARPAAKPALALGRRYRLSRYLQLRPEGDGFVAESLLTATPIKVMSPAALRLLLAWAQPTVPTALLDQLESRQREAALGFFERCLAAGLLTEVGDSGATAEDAIDSLRHWELHDLAFHVRSRRGRNPFPSGATNHLAERVPAAPALQPPADGDAVLELPRPDLEQLAVADWTLTRALESRRSRYSVAPARLEALAALLYRCCRVTGQVPTEEGELLLRKVYPSGGGLHGLEVYVVANRCTGLEPGGYRYLADRHALVRRGPLDEHLLALLEEARVGAGRLLEWPSVLLIFAARFRRVSRKYQSIAYHLLLEEVGALMQTLYLVAQIEGLAACAIGAGDSDRFAQAFGTDYYAETSLGELILGGAEGQP